VLGDPALNAKRIQMAVKVAKRHCTFSFGENDRPLGNAWVGVTSRRSRQSCICWEPRRFGESDCRYRETRWVFFCCNGRPNSINCHAEVCGVLDGLSGSGDVGRRSLTYLFGCTTTLVQAANDVPRSAGQLPELYYQKPSGKREYLGTRRSPL